VGIGLRSRRSLIADAVTATFADRSIDAPTPCLVIDEAALVHNLETMSAALPGARLRPHVKAFKCTALASRLAELGHVNFTCATLEEVAGMIRAGLGADLLLANETLNVEKLRQVVELAAVSSQPARVTIAVDSPETVTVAADAGVSEVLIDVNVGLPRCGCAPEDAGALAELARSRGMAVRGVMGYEGHLMMVEDRAKRVDKVSQSMQLLQAAADAVGGDVISAGGTGTFDTNTVATEIQAGSYTLMDAQYSTLDLPFRQALYVEATVISMNQAGGWMVADCGLKSLGMDHGDPTWHGGDLWFCSDEHVTLAPTDMDAWSVGDRVRLAPAHVDPTVAKHERMWLVGGTSGENAAEEWPVDLRHW